LVALAGQLKGVGRLGNVLELPPALALEGMTEETYLDRFVRSAASLARHLVLDCLRSSRIALYEHVHGTTAAVERLAPRFKLSNKAPTGNTAEKLQKLGGSPPRWALSEALKRPDLDWIWDPGAHRRACQADAALYQQIAELAAGMSDAREQEKLRLLERLLNQRGLVIAFDSHVLSLSLFAAQLAAAGAPAKLYSGDGGAPAKAHALSSLGLQSSDDRLIALCSDAFSEGMNLQKASVVVHLDTPTVIRTAEQRAGRVDRMDSPHAEVEIWWPREPAAFAPQRKELLRERHEVVSSLIGANLQLPDEPDTAVDVEELAARANIDQQDPRDLFDAFRPVRAITEEGGLVGPVLYQQLRTSQAELVSAVSLVDSDAPWGFFAVGALDRVAPRWILIDGMDAPPVADLAKIAAVLAERLGPNTQAHPIDTAAEAVIQRLIGRLSSCERELLPMRRRRALAQATAVLPAWRSGAAAVGDHAKVALIQRIERMVSETPTDAPFADPRSVADAWLRLIRPVQREQLTKEGRRRRLVTLDDLTKTLLANPADTDQLRRCFRDIQLLPPAAERVIAMIIGVPGVGG
jgi:hypothetical protein